MINKVGTTSRTRTDTPFLEGDFESGAFKINTSFEVPLLGEPTYFKELLP